MRGSVRREEEILAASEALVCTTGTHTGRSPQDKYIVRESATEEQVWWGPVNRPLDARNLLSPRAADAPVDEQVTIVDASGFRCDPTRRGTRSDVCVALHLARRLVIIAGIGYAGEIKKSVFTLLNVLLPPHDVLPMHCSANVDAGGDVALFFGLSGTKTTLSSDACRV